MRNYFKKFLKQMIKKFDERECVLATLVITSVKIKIKLPAL